MELSTVLRQRNAYITGSYKILDCEDLTILYALKLLAPEIISNPEFQEVTTYMMSVSKFRKDLRICCINGFDDAIVFHPNGVLRLSPIQLETFSHINIM